MRGRQFDRNQFFLTAIRGAIKFSDWARRAAPVMLLVGVLFSAAAVWLASSAEASQWVWKGWERMFGSPSMSHVRPSVFAQLGASEDYTITSINEPSAGSSAMEGTLIMAVNASGAMTGAYSDQVGVTHAFVCAAGGTSCTSFDAPNAGSSPPSGWFQGTIGLGIDTAGDIVGAYADNSNAYHGFLRKAATGTITVLDDPNAPTATSSRGTFPMGINDNGLVVGFYTTGSYDTLSLYHGFVYSVTGGTYSEVDDPSAGTGTGSYGKEGTFATAVNASGTVTGYYIDSSGDRHAFIANSPYSSASNFTTITVTGATTNTGKGGGFSGPIALSIDTAGDVVGAYTDSSQIRHGFILPAGSTTATSFNAPGANTTSQSGNLGGTLPTRIDPTGSYVTGMYTDSSGLGHGFIYYLPLTTSSSFTTFTPPNITTSTSIPIQGGVFGVNASGTVVGFYLDSNEVSHGFEYTPTATPTPTFSPVQGTYSSEQSVTISDTDSTASIYYTTDGSTPTVSSTKYTDAIAVSSTETINAIALDTSGTGYIESAEASAVYTISNPAATPTFSPAAGTYSSAQTVTISDATSGATIYYTTNGATPTTSSTVYSGPIAVSSSETIEAIATASGYSTSAVGSAAYTINLAQAATPTFSPVGGTYTSAQSVSISDSTSGSTIYYTTNGTTPTTSSTKYTGVISVSATETIEAIATASGYSNSAVASATYTINIPAAATPTFSPAAGTYTSAQTVTISDSTSGATIYYTTNGTTPTTSSTVYTSPIAVGATETIEAIAAASGDADSAVASATYTINIPVVATPTFSPAAGTYTSAQTVTITDSTSGATIYYTTNGTTPTTGSTAYTTPIAVSSSETIEAIAVASGYTNSAVATAAYTINIVEGFGPPSGYTPGSISIEPGATTSNTATISIVGTNGFSGTVNLSCTITPTAANDAPTCTLSPASVTLSGTTAQTSTLTVFSTGSSSSVIRPLWRPVGGTALAVILLFTIPRRRRNWLAMLVLLAIVASGGMMGCGGSSNKNNGTTAGSYTVTVTGTSGNTTATVATVPLTIE